MLILEKSEMQTVETQPSAWAFLESKTFWIVVRVIGLVISPIFAAGVTFGLFFFMQNLISGGAELDQRVNVIKIVDATMPEIELRVFEEIDKPEPIASIADEKPEPKVKRIGLEAGPSLNIDRVPVDLDLGLEFSNASIAATDGDYLPLVAIAPQYPERARARDIEGWCLVSFTVDGQGNVAEDSIEVIDAEPPGIFNSSSIRAAARFRFQPRVRDGVGVDVPDVQYLFQYKFNN